MEEMKEEKSFKLELTETEVNGILASLAELPAKVSMGLITKVQIQCSEQLEEPIPEEPKE